MRSYLVLSVLAVLAAAQTSTTDVPADVVPTPDALDVEGLRDLPDPTYTIIDGLMSQDVPYATATAIATVSAEISESPLSVFPAVTSIAINAAGEDDAAATATATVEKRGDGSPLERRAACATQPTIPNYYNVDVSSYSNFRADSAIASVASAAPTPAGYFQNFKNLQGASNACEYFVKCSTAIAADSRVDRCVSWLCPSQDLRCGYVRSEVFRKERLLVVQHLLRKRSYC